MAYYNRYEKLNVTYDCGDTCDGINQPNPPIYVQGDFVESGDFLSIEECMGAEVDYRWVDIEFDSANPTTYLCEDTTLYSKQKLQLSTDAGISWRDTDPLQTRKGNVIEYDAILCGGQGGYQERWVEIEFDSGDPNTYVCDGEDLYSKEKMQYKTNSIDWTDSDPLQTRKGSLLLENAQLCGGDYCFREYRWSYRSFDSGNPDTYICDGVDLYSVEIYQYSYDCGRTWYDDDPIQKRKYRLLYEDWYLCGGTQYPPIYRWAEIPYDENDPSTYICMSDYGVVGDTIVYNADEEFPYAIEDYYEIASGSSIPFLFGKFGLLEYQVSTDNGKTWELYDDISSPRRPNPKKLYDSASTDCGYNENYIVLTGNNGRQFNIYVNNSLVALNNSKFLSFVYTTGPYTSRMQIGYLYGEYSGGTITSMNSAFKNTSITSIVKIPSLKECLDFHECFYSASYYQGYTAKFEANDSEVILDVKKYDEFGNENTTDLGGMFYSASKAISEDNPFTMNTQNVVDMSETFVLNQVRYITNYQDLNVSNVVDFSNMFRNANFMYASENNQINLSKWNTSKALYMNGMFDNASISVNDTLIQNFDTRKVTNVSRMFAGLSITELDISNFSLESCINAYEMFESSDYLTTVKMPHNADSLKTMYSMFKGCTRLTDVDFSGFNPISITDMSSVFEKCSSIQSISFSDWEVPSLEDLRLTFCDCSGLTEIDMSNWSPTNLKYMDNMCTRCTNLTSIKMNKIDVSNIESYANAFGACNNLTSITCSSSLRDWIEANKEELGLQNNSITYTIV